METSTSGKILKNTVYNAIGRFWGIAVAVVMAPYIINNVGIERYGIWAFVGVLTGYFSLLDFGVGTSFVKYIAEYYAKRDHENISRLISTGVIFYLGFAALVIPLSFLVIDPLLRFFSIPAELYSEAFFVFQVGVMLFAVSGAVNAFQSIQGGLQRMDISNSISIIISIPMIAGTVYVLESGYGLRGLILNNVVVLALSCVLNVFSGFRLLPGLSLSPRLFCREMFKRLFTFGYKLQFSRIADLVVFQADRLLIAYFLNLSSVGFYQLGSTMAQNMRQLPLLLVSAILPAASDMDAKKEHEKLRELYFRGSKYLVLVSFPLVFFTIISAPLIMFIWMGSGYEKSAWVIRVLAGGYLVNLLAGVGTSIGAAIGKPEFQMGAAIVSGVTNIILSVALISLFGFLGAALSATIALVLGPLYFFVKLHAQLGVSTRDLIRRIVLLPLAACLLPAVTAWLVNSGFIPVGRALTRLAALQIFVVEGAAFSGVYIAIILIVGYLDDYDRGVLRKLAGMIPGNWRWKQC